MAESACDESPLNNRKGIYASTIGSDGQQSPEGLTCSTTTPASNSRASKLGPESGNQKTKRSFRSHQTISLKEKDSGSLNVQPDLKNYSFSGTAAVPQMSQPSSSGHYPEKFVQSATLSVQEKYTSPIEGKVAFNMQSLDNLSIQSLVNPSMLDNPTTTDLASNFWWLSDDTELDLSTFFDDSFTTATHATTSPPQSPKDGATSGLQDCQTLKDGDSHYISTSGGSGGGGGWNIYYSCGEGTGRYRLRASNESLRSKRTQVMPFLTNILLILFLEAVVTVMAWLFLPNHHLTIPQTHSAAVGTEDTTRATSQAWFVTQISSNWPVLSVIHILHTPRP